MTEEDKYALKEFLQGAGIVVFVVAVFIGLVLMSGGKPINEETFEVVDKYKECDIIRWTQHDLAEYKYFLYCEKNK